MKMMINKMKNKSDVKVVKTEKNEGPKVMEKEIAGLSALDNLLPGQRPCPEISEIKNKITSLPNKAKDENDENCDNDRLARTPKRKFCEIDKQVGTADIASESEDSLNWYIKCHRKYQT